VFNKILIANRGEIAVRVARSARALGIRSVAVYSSADRDALHVEVCDEAWCIGGAAASESYLDGERIIEVARQCGAEAIHPGYGFLSENAGFARACEAAGIVFIGPPASAIDAMGSKSEAKVLMAKAGVPLVPGYHEADQDDARLEQESKRIGYPQLIKASAGGGGKGMRLVENAKDFAAALASARREASASFGDDKVLIERYLTRPRHVELQVFAAKSPRRGARAGARCGSAAAHGCRGDRLRQGDLTEMITGQDLVEWQLRVAAGEPLPLEQPEIGCRGHAIEARIYAEMPQREFMPAAGRILYLKPPQDHVGVRIDTGVRRGDLIGINYDPMIAKLIVHGADRSAALAKLARALSQYHILGLNTNIGFLGDLVALPEFDKADFDTGFIGKHAERLFAQSTLHLQQARVLAAAAALPAFDKRRERSTDSPWEAHDLWRMNLPATQHIELAHEGDSAVVAVRCVDGGWRFELSGDSYRLAGGWIDAYNMRLELDDERIEFPVIRTADSISLVHHGQAYRFEIPDQIDTGGSDAADADHPRAPMSGAVVALPVAVGDTVAAGDTLMVIEAMKMEHAIVAEVSGSVKEILFAVGDQVDEGDTLVLLEVESR
jgi:3-methylcrotonyl-CoA carboxylase alpha subunit